MKRLTLLVSLLVSLPAAAQESKNAAYFELGGSAIIPSVNYERRFGNGLLGRAGVSVITGESESDSDTTFVFPLTISAMTNRTGSHHFEYGGGVTIAAGDRQDLWGSSNDEEKFSTLFVTGIAGYRYQKPGGGVVFRATFTPVAGGGDFLPWGGVSIGYAW